MARFAWDAATSVLGITNYTLWWGTGSRSYTNSASFGTNLSGTLSNQFVSGVKYYVAATAQDRTGMQSPFSGEVIWPPAVTNFVIVQLVTLPNLTAPGKVIWSMVLTNPPGASAFFQTLIITTNTSALVTRINSSTLLLTNTTSK